MSAEVRYQFADPEGVARGQFELQRADRCGVRFLRFLTALSVR